MPNRLQLRPVSASKEAQIRHVAASRPWPGRLVQRAQFIFERLYSAALLQLRNWRFKYVGSTAGFEHWTTVNPK